ncbi:hypothetical protein Tco_0371282 [Tanacetum coccineum]
MFELYCRSLGIVSTVNLFRVFYKVSKQGHRFSFEKRVGKGAGGRVFQETFSGMKGWKKSGYPKSNAAREESPTGCQKEREQKRLVRRGGRTVGPTDNVVGNLSNTGTKADDLWLESFVNQYGRDLNADKTKSNALTNPIALERAWFSLARWAMAQANNLERFENLQDDYTKLAEAHRECSDTVRKLVTARQDLEHNVKLYTDMTDRYKGLKEEHDDRKEYPYVKKIASGFCHSVADLLKAYPDPAPSSKTFVVPALKVSTGPPVHFRSEENLIS